VKQSGVGTSGVEADLCVSHAGDLVAGGFDDVGPGFDVGAMDGEDFFGGILEDVRGPERTVDVSTQVLEFGGQAAIKDMGTMEEAAYWLKACHVLMVVIPVREVKRSALRQQGTEA
jgi:hypothetical protein